MKNMCVHGLRLCWSNSAITYWWWSDSTMLESNCRNRRILEEKTGKKSNGARNCASKLYGIKLGFPKMQVVLLALVAVQLCDATADHRHHNEKSALTTPVRAAQMVVSFPPALSTRHSSDSKTNVPFAMVWLQTGVKLQPGLNITVNPPVIAGTGGPVTVSWSGKGVAVCLALSGSPCHACCFCFLMGVRSNYAYLAT